MTGRTIKSLEHTSKTKITKNTNSPICPLSLADLLCSTELHLFLEKTEEKIQNENFFFLAISKMTGAKLLIAIFRPDCAQFLPDREQIRRTLLCASLHVDSSFYILTNYSKLTHFSVTFTRTMGAYSSSLSGQGKSLVSTLKQTTLRLPVSVFVRACWWGDRGGGGMRVCMRVYRCCFSVYVHVHVCLRVSACARAHACVCVCM